MSSHRVYTWPLQLKMQAFADKAHKEMMLEAHRDPQFYTEEMVKALLKKVKDQQRWTNTTIRRF